VRRAGPRPSTSTAAVWLRTTGFPADDKRTGCWSRTDGEEDHYFSPPTAAYSGTSALRGLRHVVRRIGWVADPHGLLHRLRALAAGWLPAGDATPDRSVQVN